MESREIGERLREVREKQAPKVSQRDAARLLKLKEDTYRAYEYGRASLPPQHAKTLGQAWSVPWSYFYGQEVKELMVKEGSARLYGMTGEVRLLGSASAGEGDEIQADEDTITLPIQFCKDEYFALPVKGDSMVDLLYEGDYAIFHEQKGPPMPRKVWAGRSEENKWVIKQLLHTGQHYIFHPLNQSHKDIELASTSYGLEGFLVGIYREWGDEIYTRYKPTGIIP